MTDSLSPVVGAVVVADNEADSWDELPLLLMRYKEAAASTEPLKDEEEVEEGLDKLFWREFNDDEEVGGIPWEGIEIEDWGGKEVEIFEFAVAVVVVVVAGKVVEGCCCGAEGFEEVFAEDTFKGRGVRPVDPMIALPREERMAAVAGPGVEKRPLGSVPSKELEILLVKGDNGPGRREPGVEIPETAELAGGREEDDDDDPEGLEVVAPARVSREDDRIEEVEEGLYPLGFEVMDGLLCCWGPWSIAGERGPERRESAQPGLEVPLGIREEGEDMADIGGRIRLPPGVINWGPGNIEEDDDDEVVVLLFEEDGCLSLGWLDEILEEDCCIEDVDEEARETLDSRSLKDCSKGFGSISKESFGGGRGKDELFIEDMMPEGKKGFDLEAGKDLVFEIVEEEEDDVVVARACELTLFGPVVVPLVVVLLKFAREETELVFVEVAAEEDEKEVWWDLFDNEDWFGFELVKAGILGGLWTLEPHWE